MKIVQVIKHFGSKEMLAHKAGVSISTVRRWLKAGKIPVKYQKIIDYNTNGQLKAHKGESDGRQ